MSKSYQKDYLPLPEAVVKCGCDQDTLIEAASRGKFKAYVIATQWAAEGVTEPVSGYLELPRELFEEARVQGFVRVAEARKGKGVLLRFTAPHQVYFGGVFFRQDALQKFRVVSEKPNPVVEPEPGPRATLNFERTIGLLADYIAATGKNPKLLYGGHPNAKQLAEILFIHIQSQKLPRKDFSVRALEARIRKGLDALTPRKR